MKTQGYIFKAPDGSDAPFEQVFPEISSLKVVIEETGPGNEGLGLRTLTRRSVREMINCSNPACLGMGFALGSVLREMLKAGQTVREVEAACHSQEEVGKPCPNRFHVTVKLECTSV